TFWDVTRSDAPKNQMLATRKDSCMNGSPARFSTQARCEPTRARSRRTGVASRPFGDSVSQATCPSCCFAGRSPMRLRSCCNSYAPMQQVHADSVGNAVIGKPDGIFLRDDTTLDDDDRALLNAVARIVVTGSAGSLAEQLDRSERRDGRAADMQSEPRVAPLPISLAPSPAATAASEKRPVWPEPDNLLFFNGYGGFAPTMREYVIVASTDHMTPAPWTNVIANPGFGTLVSESGSASTWSENAHEFRLTPWSNDPVSDPNTEAFYIRDEDNGHFWSPTLLPTRHAGPHVARHGFGYSTFEHTEEGIESALRVY